MVLNLWYKSVCTVDLLLCNELLDLVNCNGLVNGSTGTCILTASVTDCSADCREWILMFDEF